VAKGRPIEGPPHLVLVIDPMAGPKHPLTAAIHPLRGDPDGLPGRPPSIMTGMPRVVVSGAARPTQAFRENGVKLVFTS
jgi:hypothetical protein